MKPTTRHKLPFVPQSYKCAFVCHDAFIAQVLRVIESQDG